MEYEKCLVELDEILRYLKDEDLRKIPSEIRKAINEKKDKQYNWNYDESKPLDEQNINRKTIAMLSYLNMEYLLNQEQKLFMQELHKFNEEKSEEEKRKRYNPEDIFKKNQNTNEELQHIEENTSMIVIQEEKWYKKIFNLIKNLFRKK